MPNLNRVQIAGHLGADPQTKKIKDNDFASFSIATNETIKEKKVTDWHYVECWGIWAKLAGRLKTGDGVYVEGKNKSRSYEKDGKNQLFRFIRADMLHKVEHIDLAESNELESRDELDRTEPSEPDLPF